MYVPSLMVEACVAAAILVCTPSSAFSQQTCQAKCPDGSESEIYICGSNYVPKCYRRSAPVYVAPSPDNSQQEIEQYSDLVAELSPYAGSSWIASIEVPPQTPAELSLRLNEIARRLNDLMPTAWRDFEYATTERDGLRRSIRDLRGKAEVLASAIESFEDAQKAAASESERLKQDGDRYERNVAAAMKIGSQLSAKTVETRKSVIEWLYVAAPEDSRIVELDSWKKGHDVSVPALPLQASFTHIWRQRAAAPYHSLPTAMAVPKYPYPPAALSGSSEDKLATLGPLADNLQKWNTEGAAANHETAKLTPTLASLAKQNATLESRLAEIQNLCDGTLDRRDYLRSRVIAGSQRLRAAQSRTVVRAVENFVWKTYKEHYVTPDVLAFYEENKRWYDFSAASHLDDAGVQKLVAQGKAALELLGSRTTGLQHFNEVQKQTLDLIQDEYHFLAEAPRIAALGTPQETQSYVSGLDAMVQKTSFDMMKESGAGRFSLSPDQLEHDWVPQQVLGIAKRLGLVKSPDR
jgi:hypothetical protein